MRKANCKACIILNASSGWDDKTDLASRLQQIFSERGVDCTIIPVEAGANIEEVARKAVREDAGRVVAGGGDGSLRAVASALTGTGVPMGILPAGTLNHFARDMEIPLDLEEAAGIAAAGVPVCVDVAEVNGHVFLNNSVLGLYSVYRTQREALQAGGSSRIRSILGGLFQLLWRYPLLTVRLHMNGSVRLRKTPYVMVANNEHAMEGFQPWHRDSITEGRLWIYLLRDRSRWALLRVLAKIAVGGKLAGEEFEVLRAEEVTIETRRRRLKVSLDGEMFSLDTPLRYRSRPGQLQVLVSPDSKRVNESACPAEQVR